ncbi:hypothetical protein LINGRAHAP2_LOCUS5820 [Linum grandiflorum]
MLKEEEPINSKVQPVDYLGPLDPNAGSRKDECRFFHSVRYYDQRRLRERVRDGAGGTNPYRSFIAKLEASGSEGIFHSLICLCLKAKMGRKAGQLYINPKKFGGMAKPCMTNMVSLLNCLAANQVQSEKCVKEKELLSTCLDAQVNSKNNSWGSINYHLQRLSKGRK